MIRSRKWSILPLCLLLIVLITGISSAKPPVDRLPDQSHPALQAELEEVKAKLEACEEASKLTILNPRPSRPPIIAVPISPRLPGLDGMTIAVVANYNNTMPPIAIALSQIPGVRVLYISDLPVAPGQTPRPVELPAPIINMPLAQFETTPSVADAAILGNGF